MEMFLNNVEDKNLFGKSLPMILTDAYTHHKRKTELFLTIELMNTQGMCKENVLEITITDNNDPFFLYKMRMTPDDFETWRSKEGVRCEFPKFPQCVIDYLEKCLHEGINEKPKFFLEFTINDKLGNVAKLDIKEDLAFKELIHIPLQFLAAAESSIKQYIASTFKNLKDKNHQLQNELYHSEQDKKQKLIAYQQTLSQKEQEYERLREETNAELVVKERKHAQELQKERDRLLDRLKKEQSRFEKERDEKDQFYRKETSQLQTRITVLDSLNKELEDKNYRHETTIEDLRSKVHSLEEEIKRLKDNVKNYRQKCDEKQSEIREKQSHINRLNDKINDLEQELRVKVQALSRLTQENESILKHNASLEEELENVKLECEFSDKARKLLDKDKDELNEVILNLQDKLRKLKPKTELAEKYKKTIEEKEEMLLIKKRQIDELNREIETKQSQIKSLADTINSNQEKIAQLEKDLDNKTHVVKWLNKQLTEHGITAQYTAHSDLATSPSTIAQRHLAQLSSSKNSPPIVPSNKPISKSVRNSNSPINRRNSSTPHKFYNSDATDSAYGKSPLDNDRTTPTSGELNRNNKNYNKEVDFELDTEALNAAFGEGDRVFKHSTAKKPIKPIKKNTPKITKKR